MTSRQAVVVGASAGAIEALMAILPGLPADFPAPILVVVHVPPDRRSLIPQVLQPHCALSLREAEDKEPAEAGHVYFAAADYHLLVERDGRLSLSSEEAVQFSRPSIDVLFETAADAYGPAVVALVLSGANSDGAAGARAIAQAGGLILVQSPETAAATAMPLAALTACPDALVLPPSRIAEVLLKAVSK
jgi:two-component system chemotaxis response regulator CheB